MFAGVAQLARVSPFQGEGRGFESHRPLKNYRFKYLKMSESQPNWEKQLEQANAEPLNTQQRIQAYLKERASSEKPKDPKKENRSFDDWYTSGTV